MSRNAAGTYTLPAGNPVVTATIISSTWANTTLSDLATEMTDSLDRSGKGGMLAPLQLTDGAVGAPALTFVNEPTSGLYKISAGNLGLSVLTRNVATIASTGAWVIPATTAAANAALTVGGTAASAFTPVLGVVGGANTFLTVKDTTNTVEIGFGTSGTNSSFVGALTNHEFNIRTNNTSVGKFTAAGVVSLWEGTLNVGAAGLMQAATFESGTFTATLTGCTTSPTASVSYCRTGNMVTLCLASSLTATSNVNTLGFTGLPAALQPTRTQRCACIFTDNGGSLTGYTQVTASGTVATLAALTATNIASTNFTASGTKGFQSAWTITYMLT